MPSNSSHRPSKPARRPRRLAARRQGALLCFELLLVIPLIVAFAFGALQLSLILAAQNRLSLACAEACRIGTLPADDLEQQHYMLLDAARRTLGRREMIESARIDFYPGRCSGDAVRVRIQLPMTAAAPDCLRWMGFSLVDKTLIAETTMCME